MVFPVLFRHAGVAIHAGLHLYIYEILYVLKIRDYHDTTEGFQKSVGVYKDTTLFKGS